MDGDIWMNNIEMKREMKKMKSRIRIRYKSKSKIKVKVKVKVKVKEYWICIESMFRKYVFV